MIFSLFGVTITLAQIIALVPQVIQAFKTAQAVYQILQAEKGQIEATKQAMTALNKALVKLFVDATGAVLPLPHKMTREEEELWFKRAQGEP